MWITEGNVSHSLPLANPCWLSLYSSACALKWDPRGAAPWFHQQTKWGWLAYRFPSFWPFFQDGVNSVYSVLPLYIEKFLDLHNLSKIIDSIHASTLANSLSSLVCSFTQNKWCMETEHILEIKQQLDSSR